MTILEKLLSHRLYKSGFIKFLIIGTTSFIINSLFLELFQMLGVNIQLSTFLSTELAIINNFLLNSLWTFKDRMTWKKPIGVLFRFFKFNCLSFTALLVETLSVWIVTSLLGNTPVIRQAALAGSILLLVVPLNWLMYNKVVWRKKVVTEDIP